MGELQMYATNVCVRPHHDAPLMQLVAVASNVRRRLEALKGPFELTTEVIGQLAFESC